LIRVCTLPDDALLARLREDGAYTDCYCTDVPDSSSLAAFIAAFYTTDVFKLERWILGWAVTRPSTDAQAMQLAEGTADTFAAWSVEGRDDRQILMCDFQGRTRSWLMVKPIDGGTRLYFGSAVVPVRSGSGQRRMGAAFSVLLGFHRMYSRILLRAARARLLAGRKPA